MPVIDYPIGLLALIVVMASVYSSVGHGGASGYIAAMAFFGLSPEFIKPAALTMNILVSGYVLYRLARARYFNWQLFLPIALCSMPMAYIGGSIDVAGTVYYYIFGSVLLLAAIHLFFKINNDESPISTAHWSALAPVGIGLGFISGLTGIGGGVFLSPILLLMRWTRMRTNAAIAAAFILVNSVAGLGGYVMNGGDWAGELVFLAIAAMIGALIGAEMAVWRLSPLVLRRVLGIVLLIAGGKMVLMV